MAKRIILNFKFTATNDGQTLRSTLTLEFVNGFVSLTLLIVSGVKKILYTGAIELLNHLFIWYWLHSVIESKHWRCYSSPQSWLGIWHRRFVFPYSQRLRLSYFGAQSRPLIQPFVAVEKKGNRSIETWSHFNSVSGISAWIDFFGRRSIFLVSLSSTRCVKTKFFFFFN